MRKLLLILSIWGLCLKLLLGQGCAGLSADAGPDMFTCDPNVPVQLQGNFSGTPDKYSWSPPNYLSDPNALDPIVTAPPGRYTFTFKVEAVSNTNIVNNGDFESGNAGFTHEYSYGTPGGTFGPGWLSVGTNPLSYNGAWTPCGDHTTGSGNQLIVDGHTSANAKVWCQNVALTPGKTYAFRFYVQSVYPVAPANLTATANGVPFGSVQAAGLCDWQMFEACFTATSASVELCIRETTGVGFGNDFTIDDISLHEKCMDEDEVIVEIIDLKAAINIPTLPKCASDIFDLNGLGSSTGPNIQYMWRSDGGKIISSNGITAKGQGGGIYYLKVIYRNGSFYCEKEVDLTIEPSEDLEATLEVEGIANCNQDTITLTGSVLNGSGNFSYFWIPGNKIIKGQNESTAFVIEAGVYKLVVKDKDSGCETELQDVVVSDTIKPPIQLKGDSLINCLIDSANLESLTFDTSRFQYQWIKPDATQIINTQKISTRDSGTYQLIIFDKANKCRSDQSWDIRLDTVAPSVELGKDLDLSCSVPNHLVKAQVLPLGDSLEYFWTFPNGTTLHTKQLNEPLVDQPGWVTLRVTRNTNGCSSLDSLYIKDLRLLPTVQAGLGDTLTCNKKTITLNGSGSMNHTTVQWTTPSGNIIGNAQGFQTSVDAPGWYILTVLDSTNQCSSKDSVYIFQNISKPMADAGADQVFTCADSLKMLDASNSSKGPEYIYNWTTTNGSIRSGQGTFQILVNAPGRYLLEITNQTNGCSDTSSVLVAPDFSAPVGSVLHADTLTCAVRKITLFANASSPVGNPIRYNWIADAGQHINGPNTLNPEVQEAGMYTLIIFDEVNGCSTKVSVQVAVDTLSPLASAGLDQIWNCATSQLLLSGSNSNGQHPLHFDWNSANGSIQGSPKQQNIIAKAPGIYTLLVTDSVNRCFAMDTLIIRADTVKPVTAILQPDTLTCLRTSIVLDGSPSSVGGQLTYLWTTSNGQITGPTQTRSSSANQPGIYQLIIRDTLNFCSDTNIVTVLENTQKPILAITGNTQLTCSVLSTLLQSTVQNASGKVNHLWSTSTGQIIGNPSMDSVRVNKQGWYYIQSTDITNGCSSLDSIQVTQLNDLRVDAGNYGQLTCKIRDLALAGLVFSGSGIEQYIWTTAQGNIIGNPQNRNITIDKAGTYFFRAFNPVNGCDALDSVAVSENTNYPSQAGLRIDPMKCPGDLWYVTIDSITGGEAPLTIEFEGTTLPGRTIQGNQAGSFQITITDFNGCELKKDFDILPAIGVSMNLIPFVKINAGEFYTLQPTFSIPLDSIGSIRWSPSTNLSCTDCISPVVQNLNDDIEYFCTVTDQKGCLAFARTRIEVIRRNIWIPNGFSPNGDQINDVFFPVISEDSFKELQSMQIFDRWGNRIYMKEHVAPADIRNGWNGQFKDEKMMPGVYVYLIVVEWNDSTTQLFKGDLTLIR